MHSEQHSDQRVEGKCNSEDHSLGLECLVIINAHLNNLVSSSVTLIILVINLVSDLVKS